MKSIISILALVSVSLFGYTIYQAVNPCATPLEYSIGNFDPHFGVSKNDFIKKIISSEAVWEKAEGMEFFNYNPEAKFKINLIYDERQKTIDAKQKTEFGLSQAESSFKSLDANFKIAKSNYDQRVSTYEAKKGAFLAENKQYEQDINTANSHGGAKPSEYQTLKRKQESLNAEAVALNTEASALNQELKELNQLLAQRNMAAESYNQIAQSYNQKYGSGLEFDQAEYTGKEINVYEFTDNMDLTIALSHELGHALGMDHVQNDKSIMYYLSGAQTLQPTAEDLAELKRTCKL